MAAVKSARRPAPPPARGAIRSRSAADGPSWSDALTASAAAALTMAALVLIAALAGENVAGGAAGRFWAFAFAAGLGLSGVFLALIGAVLRAGGDRIRRRSAFPLAVGAVTGVIVGALLLDGASSGAVAAPLLILTLALPPARRALAWIVRRGGGRRR